jgi:RNA polymerase sigma factor (sigma-70 family)
LKPIMTASAASAAGATDQQLVAAARGGNDEAFEALFRRYRDRIIVHVRGMVHDHGRAEDIVQETFISALRNLRATEQEIAFKPWIYQIARNACIDHLRRAGRTEEISIDSDDFKPDFEGRISEGTPQTDIAFLQRQDLDNLRQAFGGLPDSQHEILVLRELEGRSYQEIGDRMHLTPAAVESMLSRARRSLKGQYDEIATGERCRRMRPVIAAAAGGLAGKRDRHALSRHVRDCRSCRQEALVMGLYALVAGAEQPALARRTLRRAAALLPIPAFLRRRPPDAEPAAGTGNAAASVHSLSSHMGVVGSVGADQTASVLQKAAAVVAVAAVAGGGGFVAHEAGLPLPLSTTHGGKSAVTDRAGIAPAAASTGEALTGPATSARGEAKGGSPASAPASAEAAPLSAIGAPTAPQGGGIVGGDGSAGSEEPNKGLKEPAAPGVVAPESATPTPPVSLPPGKNKGSKSKPSNPSSDSPTGSSGSGSPPSIGNGSSGSGGGLFRVPPGVLHAPGLDGRLPPGILRRLDDATAAPVVPLVPPRGRRVGQSLAPDLGGTVP